MASEKLRLINSPPYTAISMLRTHGITEAPIRIHVSSWSLPERFFRRVDLLRSHVRHCPAVFSGGHTTGSCIPNDDQTKVRKTCMATVIYQYVNLARVCRIIQTDNICQSK